jgi:pheromone a factor receptor
MLARQQRVRRKLYFMTLVILAVVLPIVCVLFIMNILQGLPWTIPFDYDRIHFGPDPYNINFISFTTSDLMSFEDLCLNYISALTSIAIFISFGTSTEAYNRYRKFLLLFGLGIIFPKLHEEYQPVSRATSKRSWWSSITKPLLSRNPTQTR